MGEEGRENRHLVWENVFRGEWKTYDQYFMFLVYYMREMIWRFFQSPPPSLPFSLSPQTPPIPSPFNSQTNCLCLMTLYLDVGSGSLMEISFILSFHWLPNISFKLKVKSFSCSHLNFMVIDLFSQDSSNIRIFFPLFRSFVEDSWSCIS